MLDTNRLFDDFLAAFPEHLGAVRVEVALSGGLDSVVLLHLLRRVAEQKPFALSAVHVHHGLSENADAWADFCADLCRRWQVPLRTVRVQLDTQGLGIEAAARQARYQAFSDGCADIVALAHHQNDQIETFMLGVARGGGIRALAAMPSWRALPCGKRLWRPLLNHSRAKLAAYAAANGLDYVEDESNADTSLLRNRMRLAVLPELQRSLPHFERHVLANIETLQQNLALLDEIAAADYAAVCGSGRFSAASWRNLSEARRMQVLQEFVRRHGLAAPTRESLREFARVLMQAQQGQWRVGGETVVYYRDSLFVWEEHSAAQQPWCAPEGISGRLKTLAETCGITWQPHPQGLPASVLTQNVRIVSAAQQEIKLAGGSKRVGKVLQAHHILPPVRRYWPIIINEAGECLAVVNLCAAAGVQAEQGVLPVFAPFGQYMAD